MTPSEFRLRFVASLPEIPADVDLTLDEFVSFPIDRVKKVEP